VDSDSFEQRRWEEWKMNAPVWQKEIISERLILKYRLGDRIGRVECGASISEPLLKFFEPLFLSEICDKVWVHFGNLPPEETVGRHQVLDEFERIVSSSIDIPDATKEAYLESLRQPFHSSENKFREVVGLSQLQGEENGHRKI
jgi:hypothetical protein